MTKYGLSQPRVSELFHDKVDRCTLEWLIRRIHLLGGRVTMDVAIDGAKVRRIPVHPRRVAPRAPFSIYGRGLDA